MCGPAGAPAAGLSRWERPPGTGAPRWSAAADPSGSSDTDKYLTRAISSAPISLARRHRVSAALRAALRAGFTRLDPAATRKDSAPVGKTGRNRNLLSGRRA